MVETLFDPTAGLAGLVKFLGMSTDGWFFMWGLIALFIISFIPSMIKWGTDWPLLSASLGCLLVAIPIYLMKGFGEGTDADIKMFVWVLLFALSVVKIAVFKDD